MTSRILKSLEKHSESRLTYLCALLHHLSSHSASSVIFSPLLFSSLTLLTSAFPSVHFVGSSHSERPSMSDAIWLPCFSSLPPASSSALPQHPSGRKIRLRMKNVELRTSISTDAMWVPYAWPGFSLTAFTLRLCCSPGCPKNI